MKPFVIAQITDLHLVSEDENAYGVNVRENFLSILQSIITCPDRVNHIVITGDICFSEPDEEIYEWVKERLEDTGIPYSLVAGNHDDIEIMKQVFSLPDDYLKDDEMYYCKDLGSVHGFFLDTSKKYLSEEQINWLREKLQNTSKDYLIFMHHPPVKAGIRFMDTFHSLENGDSFAELFAETDRHVNVFCGHYHVDKEVNEKNISVFITPSAIYQFDHVAEEFLINSYEFGWRKISWHREQGLETVVSYLRN